MRIINLGDWHEHSIAWIWLWTDWEDQCCDYGGSGEDCSGSGGWQWYWGHLCLPLSVQEHAHRQGRVLCVCRWHNQTTQCIVVSCPTIIILLVFASTLTFQIININKTFCYLSSFSWNKVVQFCKHHVNNSIIKYLGRITLLLW